ncbi:MAG: MFS transporter [Gordonibacter sp.]
MQLAHPQKRLGPRSFFACALAINLLLILSIDMYVPALPSMQRVFDVTEAYLNLTVFAFFVFSAVGVIMAGPVSDRFGRKPVLVFGCMLFAASSLFCTLAPTVEVLIVFRIGQALGYGAVVTIETALIKDSFDGNDLKLAMTALQSLIIIGPAVAPFLGTFILTFSDWRGIFTLLTVCGFVALGLSLLISETHPHASKAERSQTGVGAALGSMVSDIRILMHDRKFSSLALFMGIAGMPYFAFIAVVSYILMDFFAVSYFEYSMIYAGACLVTIAAPYVYVALSKRLSVRAILVLCVWLTAASFVMLALFGTASPVLFLVAFVPYALAEGIVRPMAFVVLLDQPSSRVGAASSFSNFSYALLTSFATVIATLQWPNFIFGIAVLTGASVLVMAGLYVWGLRKKAN